MAAQTVLITGANRGLGFEFTRQYAADGWDVIACCRNPEEALALSVLPGVRVEPLDVTDDGQIGALAKRLKGVGLDVLISCAGIYSGDPARSPEREDLTQRFGSLDSDGWMKVLRTNTVAPLMLAEALIPNLSKGGKVAFISSAMGGIGRLYRTGDIAYRTSKAALNMAMKSVSLAVQDKSIVVVSFHPGWVRTDMGGKDADLSPEESVSGMRRVIDKISMENTGAFLNFDGSVLPW